jgi:beta-galactosidase/beta-glucuronidase
VFDPTDDQSIPQGKQTKRLSHIFYTPCTGIWQTVWLESVPKNFISDLNVAADMEGKGNSNPVSKAIRDKPADCLTVSVTVHSWSKEATPVEVSIAAPDGDVVASHQHVSDQAFTFNVPSPEIWSPDSPVLYNITVTMGDDEVKSYTGFRTISTGAVNGIQRPLLNGDFVFMFGPLDQGYWPDGLYTPPTLEAMVYDLELIKSLGMNMVRKHIKVEPDLFYEACDQLGLLVIQDMPSMRVFTNARPTDAEQKEFERQLEVMVNEHKSYPSIVAWVIYNEGWGQITDYFPEIALTDRVRELDPTRLINSVTGWHDHGAGDFHGKSSQHPQSITKEWPGQLTRMARQPPLRRPAVRHALLLTPFHPL